MVVGFSGLCLFSSLHDADCRRKSEMFMGMVGNCDQVKFSEKEINAGYSATVFALLGQEAFIFVYRIEQHPHII